MVSPDQVQVHVANLDGRKVVSICWSEGDEEKRNHQLTVPFDVFHIAVISDEVRREWDKL